ncbi:MAG: DNA-3-methyladenine glycosylase 2 family protein [Deltaproteobacteria bacterium]|nr:MAG: DNA-3-methyladenine glycosylase 2 family protein [Deltaproteobacteria bacterium]
MTSVIVRKLEIKIDPSSLDQAIREAEHYLAHADPVMRRLIARHGPCPLAEREFEPFHMLANSIISQQLSTKAAATIKQRVGELVGVPFQTEKVLAVSSEKLRDAGLSQAKARYIRELAARVVDGRLIFDELMAIEDEAVIEKLIEANGIGRWTAEMFLLFGLKRLDVLALGDAGLQRSARILYGKRRKSETLLRRVAEAWKPYRSIACWYLWRSLEDV